MGKGLRIHKAPSPGSFKVQFEDISGTVRASQGAALGEIR
jgi:hypothetical protein